MRQLGSNNRLQKGEKVCLSPDTQWRHEYYDCYLRNRYYDIANPTDVDGEVISTFGEHVYVKWEGGWINCYPKRDSDLIKVNV